MGLADSVSIEASLAEDASSILIDTVTGHRVPHFAEVDSHTAAPDVTGVISIRPAVRLAHGRRYVAALRNVRNASDAVIPPTSAFVALRDGAPVLDPRLAARREPYARIMADLDRAGIPKDSLQIAWEFTTASESVVTGRLLHMRDEALAEIGDGYSPYEIDSRSTTSDLVTRIEGRVTVPLYLDQDGFISLDARSMPIRRGTTDAKFILEIPNIAATRPCEVLQYGDPGYAPLGTVGAALRPYAQDKCFVTFGMEWLGYRNDHGDSSLPIVSTTSGDPSRFRKLIDLNLQAMIQQMLGLRAVLRGLAHDERTFRSDGNPTIATTNPSYFGLYQGATLGVAYLAISPDLERGVLANTGASYSNVLARSAVYTRLLRSFLPTGFTPIRIPLLLGFAQLMWDRVDPGTYAPYLVENRFEGTPERSVLILNGIGDPTAPSIAGQWLARNAGIPLVTPTPRPHAYLLETRAENFAGSGYVEIRVDPAAVEPVVNLAATGDSNLYVSMWMTPGPLEVIEEFLVSGKVMSACEDACVDN
jgi:hypothetical protein